MSFMMGVNSAGSPRETTGRGSSGELSSPSGATISGFRWFSGSRDLGHRVRWSSVGINGWKDGVGRRDGLGRWRSIGGAAAGDDRQAAKEQDFGFHELWLTGVFEFRPSTFFSALST